MTHNQPQSIGCDVKDCKYNTHGSACSLHNIQVSNATFNACVDCCEDSMCASFEKKR